MQSGESPFIQEKARLCFSREAVSEEEGTFQRGIIPWRPQIKYLGVILDSQVNCGAHMHRVLGRPMSGTVYSIMIGRGKLDSSHKIRIYKTVVIPATTHMNKLQPF
ncbi:hypothetical protein Trydic_g20503 [Trypoxylus dichotomus]